YAVFADAAAANDRNDRDIVAVATNTQKRADLGVERRHNRGPAETQVFCHGHFASDDLTMFLQYLKQKRLGYGKTRMPAQVGMQFAFVGRAVQFADLPEPSVFAARKVVKPCGILEKRPGRVLSDKCNADGVGRCGGIR